MIAVALCLALSPAATVSAQTFSPPVLEMFRGLGQQPNELARYAYLTKAMPDLPLADRIIAMQLYASAEDELGLYNEALRDFPLKSRVPADTQLPTPAGWKSADAVDVVAQLAADRRLVLVNEAHHDAHTRQLTLSLLPRLRALGFNYFAAEALLEGDRQLMQRGYPVRASGTEYLLEPSYGEIVRTAIKLGFIVVAYDVDSRVVKDREAGQAENLYRKVFARDPHARLFVHAGYAHIDKARGRLGQTVPMAMHLQQQTGIEPLSIDQTQFREEIPATPDAYQQLVKDFAPTGPTVLLDRATGKPWSAHPDRHDANVILPPSGQGAIESGYMQPATIVHDMNRVQPMLARHVNTRRPEWLARHGERVTYAISTTLCRVTSPCVVDAHYADEPDEAIAADRYAFLLPDAATRLYLRPGRYRLRAWDIRGRTLSEQGITVRAR